MRLIFVFVSALAGLVTAAPAPGQDKSTEVNAVTAEVPGSVIQGDLALDTEALAPNCKLCEWGFRQCIETRCGNGNPFVCEILKKRCVCDAARFYGCDKCYKCELHNYAEVEESVGVQERAEVQAEDTATVQDAVVDEISVTPDAPVVAGVAGMDCKECGDKYEDCRKHDCKWWMPSCHQLCTCETAKFKDCKKDCGWECTPQVFPPHRVPPGHRQA